MALQLRRGTSGTRTSITPAAGELIYTTDTKLVYVGDGTTAGGTLVTGGGVGGGISSLLDDASPQLGGDLDVYGRQITSNNNGNVVINPNGTGVIALNANITTTGNIRKTGELSIESTVKTTFGNILTNNDGNVYIVRETYSSAPAQGFTFAQHHATAEAVNFTFYRSRGTGNAQTAVLNGDRLINIAFAGHDGTSASPGGAISAVVEGTPVTGHVPTKISFATDNGANLAYRAELSSAGVWKVNSIQNISGSTLTVTAASTRFIGDVQINAQGDLRFADSDSSNYVGFQAPSTVTSNVLWTLPATDGSSGQALTTNGTGTLTWATFDFNVAADDSTQRTVSSGETIKFIGAGTVTTSSDAEGNITITGSGGAGTSLQSRNTVQATTASIANTATGDVTFTGAAKGYVLYKIQTTAASWVRLYTDISSRTADASRAEGVDPSAGAGVVAEIITTGAQTVLISPGTLGFNNESSPVTEIYAAVTNKSGSTTTITVTLTILKIEV